MIFSDFSSPAEAFDFNYGPHPEEAPTGPREARPDDRLRAVSKDEATGFKRNVPI